MLLIALTAAHPLRMAAAVSAAYGLLWEGGQAALGGPLWDGALDWTAVTLGALTAAALWQHRRGMMAAAVGAVLVILGVGAGRRNRK